MAQGGTVSLNGNTVERSVTSARMVSVENSIDSEANITVKIPPIHGEEAAADQIATIQPGREKIFAMESGVPFDMAIGSAGVATGFWTVLKT